MIGKFILAILLLFPFIAKADEMVSDTFRNDTILIQNIELNSISSYSDIHNWKYRLVDRIKKNIGENNKAVAAVLAFPIFGIIGLHRIYLGTKPYVPVVYIATLGGGAGILPLIDFFAIIFADKETFECYKENPNVFMWVK